MLNRLLAHSAQIEMILIHLAEQLTRVTPQSRLQLAMLKTGSLRAVSPHELLIKQLTRALKRIGGPARNRAGIAARVRPIGQDFTTQRVISARKGVEIGGHRGHLRGRR
jgi:hypothetical protein